MFPGEKASNETGLTRTTISRVFAGLFFGNFRDEASCEMYDMWTNLMDSSFRQIVLFFNV